MPTKRSGRPEPPAISVMLMVDVLLAKIACGAQILSSLPKSSCFTGRLSNTASITRSQSAKSAKSVLPCHCSMISGSCSAASLPRSMLLRRKDSVWPRARSSACWFRSNTRVRKPARAQTMAMPAPMVPAPATPMVLISLIEVSLNRSAPQEAAADKLPVNLVRAFPDLRDLGVAHQALDAIVLAVSIAAMKLHGIGRNAHCEIRRAHLQHRRFDAEFCRAAVDEPRDMPQPSFA